MKDTNLDEQRIPLAERLRPRTLDEVVGQKKLVGPGGILRQIVEKKEPVSLIFWGSPGTGKTTLARIIAREMDADFIEISAVTAKKADVEKVVERARQNWNGRTKSGLPIPIKNSIFSPEPLFSFGDLDSAKSSHEKNGSERKSQNFIGDGKPDLVRIRTILFVDEIHRFNKAQQDAFLPHVESGLITLIGATTENPSFEVISPLISRSRVVVLEQLSRDEVKEIIERAVKYLFFNKSKEAVIASSSKKSGVSSSHLLRGSNSDLRNKSEDDIYRKITPDAIETLAEIAHGDARVALGNLEIAAGLIKNRQKITREIVEQAAGTKLPRYDKTGDGHYDTISAFIKSMRAGDDQAALYYMARMIAAGEDPKFIARRMVIFASEDVGLTGNGALGLALNAFMAIERVGLPEGGIVLSHVAVALSRAKKSRESNDMWATAQNLAAQFPDAPVPIHVRNAPTKLMKELGFGQGQKWEAGFRHEKGYLPEEVAEFLNANQSSGKTK